VLRDRHQHDAVALAPANRRARTAEGGQDQEGCRSAAGSDGVRQGGDAHRDGDEVHGGSAERQEGEGLDDHPGAVYAARFVKRMTNDELKSEG